MLGDLTIDYAQRLVSLAGRPVPLTGIEYRALAELSSNAGRVLTYEHLLRRVWRLEGGADVRPTRTVISSLRRKLGDDAEAPRRLPDVERGDAGDGGVSTGLNDRDNGAKASLHTSGLRYDNYQGGALVERTAFMVEEPESAN